jgi:hypothetical protein
MSGPIEKASSRTALPGDTGTIRALVRSVRHPVERLSGRKECEVVI